MKTAFLSDAAPGRLLDPLPAYPLAPGSDVFYRRLEPPLAAEIAAAAREAAAREGESFAERLAWLGEVADAWLAPRSPLGARACALLRAREGWSPAMLRPALRHLFRGLTEASLRELARRELGGRPPKPPGLVAVFASGNLPVAVLPHLVYALALGAPVVVRVSAREPVLPRLLRDSLRALASPLAERLVLLHWPREDRETRRAVLAEADVILAFGRDATLAEIEPDVPETARFLPYGSRASLAALGRERLRSAALPVLAARVGRDLAAWDQQGCHSPQAIYVEEGGEGDAAEFAAALAEALAAWQRRWPRRPLEAAEHAAIHQWRAAAEMRLAAEPAARLWTSPHGTEWSVFLDPDPAFSAPGLPRQAVVRPVPVLEALPAALAGWEERLETAALAADPARREALAQTLCAAGARRVCPAGRAQEPDMLAPHDGRTRLSSLLR